MEEAIQKTVLEVTKKMEAQVDKELDRLDKLDDDDLEAFRERRLQQMKKEAAQRQEWMQKGHGEYKEIPSEKELFGECKASTRVVCHFYRPTTGRCEIVDKHLKALAPRHVETKFLKLNVEKAPFMCERLNVRVLPSILCFKDNKVEDRITGFDSLGGVDDFPTEMMEWRLGKCGVIHHAPVDPPTLGGRKKASVLKGKRNLRDAEDSDDDDDY